MVAKDDLEGKTTHFTGFYIHTISGPKIPKPPIVVRSPCLRIPFKQIFNLSHSWDEFDQMRRDMIAESRQAWNKFDEDMKRLETKSFSKSLNIDTNLNEANNPTPPKDEVKQEKKETNVVEEIKTKDLKSENLDEDRRSFFSPIKFVRFPSMFGDEKVENRSLFKDENVIKVNQGLLN